MGWLQFPEQRGEVCLLRRNGMSAGSTATNRGADFSQAAAQRGDRSGTRRFLADELDPARDGLAGPDSEPAPEPRAIGISDFLLDGARAGVIFPHRPKSFEIVDRRDSDLPVAVSRLENLLTTALCDAVGIGLVSTRHNPKRRKQVGQPARDVP